MVDRYFNCSLTKKSMHTHKLFMVPRGGFEPPTLGLEDLFRHLYHKA